MLGPLLVLAALAGALGARTALPLAALGLAGCPAAPGSSSGTGPASPAAPQSATPAVVFTDSDFADLSGIQLGQRWVYELDGGALELVRTVRELSRAEVVYTEYTVRRIPGLAPEAVGHDRLHVWGWSPTRQGERPFEGAALEPYAIPAGPLELSGVVVGQAGDQVLMRVVGGRPAFPGELRVERGGRVIRRLVRID